MTAWSDYEQQRRAIVDRICEAVPWTPEYAEPMVDRFVLAVRTLVASEGAGEDTRP